MRYVLLALLLCSCGNPQLSNQLHQLALATNGGSYDEYQGNSRALNQQVYSEDECVGTVIMGVCHGSILPMGAYHPTCYGDMLAGQCTGPLF